jgi:hypothetical protein
MLGHDPRLPPAWVSDHALRVRDLNAACHTRWYSVGPSRTNRPLWLSQARWMCRCMTGGPRYGAPPATRRTALPPSSVQPVVSDIAVLLPLSETKRRTHRRSFRRVRIRLVATADESRFPTIETRARRTRPHCQIGNRATSAKATRRTDPAIRPAQQIGSQRMTITVCQE